MKLLGLILGFILGQQLPYLIDLVLEGLLLIGSEENQQLCHPNDRR